MYQSTKIIDLGSCAFRQPKATSHCRHIHGYRLSSKIWFACIELDENNWVMDFGGLKELKESLEDIFDHTLVISSNDPCLDTFKELEKQDAAKLVVMDGVGIEKFARTVFYIADEFVKRITLSRVWVEQVEVWEHEKNSAKFVKPIEPIIVSQSFNHPATIL
jgi:6-pyruvoyltetrahydropterin/6-carboxytetrahydropterin synthase